MPAGRPTLYSDDVLAKTREYLESCEDSFERYVSDNGKFTHVHRSVNLPTVEGLAVHLGVSRDTLYEWEKHHPEFSDTLGILKAKQAENLINKGLSGDYNSTIAKLMLSSNHGMREKSDVTTDGKALPTPIMDFTDVPQNDRDEENSEPV